MQSDSDLSSWVIEPIGYVHSPYKQKFGVARQPGLVPAALARIELLPQFDADCIRGLTDYDFVWVQFVFHAAVESGWQKLIRPPKLGGKEKKGVFATRSPHRPNHLGLSLLKLERIDIQENISLWFSGVDLLDQTPVIDIKPYLPFVEAKADARGGFARQRKLLQVVWSETALQQLQALSLDQHYRTLVSQSVAQDPRPAHQSGKDKIFVMFLGNYDIRFRVDADMAVILTLDAHG
ncbi:tRNA (N6-threonylcarbamoyladenosine(37)-N6)-methyltransferase TrmO [Neisseriaceae bacterium ESL0693]|nr:tRNA (N6-threonylcarbamoyladenosine(37)-N6)-methyltransferase TrmO [Neisseriaceae bacterium ESL0693]